MELDNSFDRSICISYDSLCFLPYESDSILYNGHVIVELFLSSEEFEDI